MNKTLQWLFDFLSSLKLAVIVILSLAIVSAWGTIVESQFDARTAQKLVFYAPIMRVVLALLVINLVFSAVDRLPWKKRHMPFLLAHLGIIVLVAGSMLTQKFGVDGSIVFGIGESRSMITIPDTEITVHATMDGDDYRTVFFQEVDFFKNPPNKDPLRIPLPDGDILIKDFAPYSFRQQKVLPSQLDEAGPAVRFVFQNKFMAVTEWVMQSGDKPGVHEFGPARIVMHKFGEKFKSSGRNEILLRPSADPLRFAYEVHSERRPKDIKKGTLTAGDALQTGWMDAKFRVLKYLPKAVRKTEYKRMERPTELTSEAVLVVHGEREEWVGLNSLVRFFADDVAYVVTYGNRRIKMGFDMTLEKFEVGHYQGTRMAASYESVVKAKDFPSTLISMNEPLKYNGFTFYQASYQTDEMGNPTASILSVNYDPGRFWKYLGSIILVSGIINLFYLRNRRKKFDKGVSL